MRTERTLIEVAICTWNNAALLEKTLETLACQRTPPALAWSVLVVDNASTDHTASVVDRAIETGRVPGLRRVYESRQGLVPARLRAVRETAAPWIAFVDDDCLLADTWLANAAAFIEAHPDCGGFGGIVRLDWESPPPGYVPRFSYSYAEQEHGAREARREWLVGAGLILNRAALARSGWQQKQYLGDRKGGLLLSGGDMEMVLRIRAAGYELWYTPHCVIRHHIPARRTSLGYLTRINFGLGISQTWCDLLVCSRPYAKYMAATLAQILKGYLDSAKQAARVVRGSRNVEDFKITLSFANGRVAGFKQILWLNPGSRAEALGCARARTAGAP
jgi:glycosyltransferase involved in cell wall biosynthesis